MNMDTVSSMEWSCLNKGGASDCLIPIPRLT